MSKSQLAIVLIVAVALIAVATASPARPAATRRHAKSSRQVATTTERPAKTPYPAAGFRPRIPFDLPNERPSQPEPTTPSAPTISTTAGFSTTSGPESREVTEDFGIAEPTSPAPNADKDEEVSVIPDIVVVEVEEHTPADTYGAPDVGPRTSAEAEEPASPEIESDLDNAIDVDVEDVPAEVAAPAEDFQPPTQEPAGEFLTPPLAGAGDDRADGEPVADLPAAGETAREEPAASGEFDDDLEAEGPSAALSPDVPRTPADSYGPPLDGEASEAAGSEQQAAGQPAEVYGVPGVVLELDEAASGDDASAVEVFSRLSGFPNGRLIFVPASGKGQVRQVYATQGQRKRSGRLVRI